MAPILWRVREAGHPFRIELVLIGRDGEENVVSMSPEQARRMSTALARAAGPAK
jgi:hypothetical protein